MPEIVFADSIPISRAPSRTPRFHALIRDSAGLNLALDYLPGSVTYDPLVTGSPPDLASRIVWFDAYVTNVDRTGAQHEHADVAPAAVADRSRRDAVLSSLAGLGSGAGAGPGAVSR